jgi:FtsP/CotA-like multicopper oxidase with cupredoxin domain
LVVDVVVGDDVGICWDVRLQTGAPASSTNPINFTTRAYNGQIPGPTIRVKQGDVLQITLVNALGPKTSHSGEDTSGGAQNTFRLSNVTNLHMHGLHISPEGTSDNVFRQVGPQQRGLYVYNIPADHPVGTFWYHPHVHGSSSLQQGGGMAGALIVDPADPNSYLPVSVNIMPYTIAVKFVTPCFCVCALLAVCRTHRTTYLQE